MIEFPPDFKRSAGFTLIELLVLLAVVAILASLLLPASPGGLVKGATAQCTSNYRQLYILTQTASLDGLASNNPHQGFPADCGGTLAAWSNCLVSNGYVTPKVFKELLSVKGKIANSLVYNVSANNDPSTVFIATANLSSNGVADKPPYFLKGGSMVTVGGSAISVTGTNMSPITNAIIWATSPPLKVP